MAGSAAADRSTTYEGTLTVSLLLVVLLGVSGGLLFGCAAADPPPPRSCCNFTHLPHPPPPAFLPTDACLSRPS